MSPHLTHLDDCRPVWPITASRVVRRYATTAAQEINPTVGKLAFDVIPDRDGVHVKMPPEDVSHNP
jgi:hypothetical protein